MDYNTQNLNGTSLSAISQNNYQQQNINNIEKMSNIMNTQMNNQMNNNDTLENSIQSSITEKFTNNLYNNENHIQEITKEILNGLTENNISLHDNESDVYHKKKSKSKKTSVDFGNNIEQKIENTTNETKNFISTILKSEKVKDVLIIFILFFIMSQDMIKELFAQYFTSINPDESGRVGAKGVVIYGIIFAILFIIIKNFF